MTLLSVVTYCLFLSYHHHSTKLACIASLVTLNSRWFIFLQFFFYTYLQDNFKEEIQKLIGTKFKVDGLGFYTAITVTILKKHHHRPDLYQGRYLR